MKYKPIEPLLFKKNREKLAKKCKCSEWHATYAYCDAKTETVHYCVGNTSERDSPIDFYLSAAFY